MGARRSATVDRGLPHLPSECGRDSAGRETFFDAVLVHERAKITARGDALPEARRTVLPRARVAASATTRMGAKASMAAMKGMWVLTSVTTGVRVLKSFRWETREERGEVQKSGGDPRAPSIVLRGATNLT